MSHPGAVASTDERPAVESFNPLALAGLALCIVASWILQHPYEGLVHDSVLYSFSALARLHPESLGHDVILTLGSQDRYTVFSPIAAAVIRVVGFERAAALLTLIGQIALFGSGWLLARRLMPPALAMLSAGLLVVLPGVYGAQHLFSYSEAFMTPRVPSAAFVLAALVAVLGGRYALGGLCIVAAILLHPLMAAAGMVALFVVLVGLPRPKLAIGLALGAFAALVAISWATPFGPIGRFDAIWFDMLHSRLEYLFPSLWSLPDWGHALVPFATLAAGAITATQPPTRSICCAALITGLCGLGLSIVGSDLLHIVIVAQIQPWRWLWLSNALAVILIPVIAINCWQKGYPTRAAVVLLAAAWISVDERFVPVIALLAVAAAATADRITDAHRGRLLFLGSCAVLLLGTVIFTGTVLSVIGKMAAIPPDTTLYNSDWLLGLRQLRPWASGGILPACVLLLVWWIGSSRNSRGGATAALVVASALCAMFAPLAWNAWTRTAYRDDMRAQFAPWRQQIPLPAQVLWPDAPFGPWYLLERPSYWSTRQMAGLVFSRAMAIELTRREEILTRELPGEPLRDLIETCRNNPELGFIVTARELGPTPFAPMVIDSHRPDGRLRLYRCADHRG